MKIYDTVIFDLDGTAVLNDEDAKPSETLIKVVRESQDKLNLCAATGRSMIQADSILKALNLTDPCVISAGTQIVNPQTGEILWEVLMNLDDSRKILGMCKSYHYKFLIGEETMDIAKPASETEIIEPVNVIYVMEVSKEDSVPIMKAFCEIEGITASKVPSWLNLHVDIHITSKEATKEHAIRKLIEILDTTKEKTIGVGDADNDIPLFKSVGLKVAVGNATDNLKKKADIIAENVENNGLAKIIEKYS